MAFKRKDGRYGLMVYFTSHAKILKIKRAAALNRQSMSAFAGLVLEQEAERILEVNGHTKHTPSDGVQP
jgi:hypothetical protein